jgi:hypothetical protein
MGSDLEMGPDKGRAGDSNVAASAAMFKPFSGTHSGCLAFGAPPLAPVPAGQAIGALPARPRGLSVVPRGLLCASRAAAAGGAGDAIEISSPAATIESQRRDY